jgi:hypothetical protein
MSFLANFTRFPLAIINLLSDAPPPSKRKYGHDNNPSTPPPKKRDRDHDTIPSTPPPSKRRRHEDMLTPGQKILRDKMGKRKAQMRRLMGRFIPIDLQDSFEFLENKHPNLFYILVGKIGEQVFIKPGYTNARLPQRMNDLKAKYGFDTLVLKELHSINRISDELGIQKYLSSKFSSIGELNGKVTTEIYSYSEEVYNTIKKGLQVVGYDSHLEQLYPLENEYIFESHL